ncbi:MAG: SRPBCC family protein [Planctomycetes bacterium]|nr:SRPBCC family protein [Planctomycetota bacterium]
MPRYHVYRSNQINATPQKVFDTISDFRTWTTWSPWLGAEPDAKVTVTENASSIGSIYSWQGELVGQGEIEHRDLQPGRLIKEEIRFLKPFKSKSEVAFEMELVGDGTKLTWHMRGALPWFLFWMKPQMEVFIGMDYERGLKMLKELLETGQILSETKIRGVEPVGPLRMAGVRKKYSLNDIGPSMAAMLADATEKFSKHNLPTDGEPMSVYHDFDMKSGIFDYTAGFALPESVGSVSEELSCWSLSATKALRVDHIGSYENLGNAWSAANQFARYKKLKQSKAGAFEIYKNNPNDTSPADLRTEISLPLR